MDELTDIFGSSEQSNTVEQNNAQTAFNIDIQQVEEPNVISMDQLIEEEQANPTKVVKKKDKILITQIVLIVLWVISTVLVYYFGYDFFEPFINV